MHAKTGEPQINFPLSGGRRTMGSKLQIYADGDGMEDVIGDS